MSNTLSTNNKKVTIRLGETDYELSPMNMNVLGYVEEEFGVGIDGIGTLFDKDNAEAQKHIARNLLTLLHIMLRDNHPDLTKQEIGKHILANDLPSVSETLSEAMSIGMPEA